MSLAVVSRISVAESFSNPGSPTKTISHSLLVSPIRSPISSLMILLMRFLVTADFATFFEIIMPIRLTSLLLGRAFIYKALLVKRALPRSTASKSVFFESRFWAANIVIRSASFFLSAFVSV